MELIPLDGAAGEGGGQVLRAALALSAASGQAFRIDRIRARRARPGLRPQHLAAVRAAGMACAAEIHGAFDGSPDLRFLPGQPAAGDFHFDIGSAGATTLVLETLVPILGTASAASRVELIGGTHVPHSPSFEFVARHWSALVERLGLRAPLTLERVGFHPRGGGVVRGEILPWPRPATLDLTRRGALVALRGVAGQARLRGDVARRAADAARALAWEQRRLEMEWEVAEHAATSPGAFVQVEAVFENGRAAFALLAERGLRPEVLGERAMRRLLRFLGEEEAAVDPQLADQLAVPLALGGGGGRISTSEVTTHLETVAGVLRAFGFDARTYGRRGGPGGFEVAGRA